LYRVLAAGGAAPLATYSGERVVDGWPSFLPDGRHFLFFGASPRAGASNVYVGSLDSRETKTIIHSDWAALYAPPGYLLFLRGSTLIARAFDADRLAANGDPSPIAEHLGSASLGRAAFSVSDVGTLLYTPGACVGYGGARFRGAANAAESPWVGSPGSWSAGFQSLASYILIPCRASTPLIQGGSRMRRRARTVLCGGRPAMIVPTATRAPG